MFVTIKQPATASVKIIKNEEILTHFIACSYELRNRLRSH